MKSLRKSVLSIIFSFTVFALSAQVDTVSVVEQPLSREQELCRIIGAEFPVPVVNYTPVTPPKFWKKGALTELGFSQVSLTNWAAGGSGSVAFNAHINAHINYEKGSIFWENRGQFSYGFVQSFEDGYRKSDDKLILDSKFGLQAYDNLYFSSVFNLFNASCCIVEVVKGAVYAASSIASVILTSSVMICTDPVENKGVNLNMMTPGMM